MKHGPIALIDKYMPVVFIAPKDKTYLKEVLAQGASAAQRRANKILSKVYRKVGFPDREKAK